MWCPPTIALKWGSYFAPDSDDDAKIVDTAIKAHDAGLVTLRSAVQRVQRTFNIENVDQFLTSLEEEQRAKQARLANDMHAMVGIGDSAAAPMSKSIPSNAKPAASGGTVSKAVGKVGE